MKRVLLILLITLLLTGCWDQKIYEKIGFTLVVGMEASTNSDNYLITAASPIFGIEKGINVEVLTSKAKSFRQAREMRNRLTANFPEAGKMQAILFSDEMAKTGIHPFLEIFHRVPEDPALSWVVITEGSPREMLVNASKFKDKPAPGFYLNQLLENSSNKSYTPETRICNFDIDYYAKGIDPITPIIKLKSDGIEVKGSALFSDDKMVGKLNSQQTLLLMAMKNSMKNTFYITAIPVFSDSNPKSQKTAAINLNLKKRTLKVKIENDKPVINIFLTLTGNVSDYIWDNLNDIPTQEKIERNLEKQIKADCINIIKYTQEVGSDPIGIGDIIRAKYISYWNRIDWKEAYKNARIDITVKLNIDSYGTIK